MSPGLWYTFGYNGENLTNIQSPLAMIGTQDSVLGYENEAMPAYNNLASPKGMVVYDKVGHYGFTHICMLASFLFEECDADADYPPMEEVHASSKVIATAYIGYIMHQDWRYLPWLSHTHWPEQEIHIEHQFE